MTLKSIAVKTGIATIAITAMGLVAAAPASAHTNNMYTYVLYDDNTQQAYYATYGKADGVTSPLPTSYVAEQIDVLGIEVAAEKGTEIGWAGDPYVLNWDHTTGDSGDFVAAYSTVGESDEFRGLDTLNNGTTVTILFYTTVSDGEVPIATDHIAVASVNSGTGEITPLVDFQDAISFELELIDNPTSLATDPATGITYVFLQNPAGEVEYLPIDVATATVGEPTLFQGEYFVEGEINGSDFDPGTGELYFNYFDNVSDRFELLKLGAPAGWVTAEPTFISTAPADAEDIEIAQLALTIEYTALAATGSELPIFAIMLVGTVAVVAGGVTVMVAHRRAEAGTV